MTDTVTAPAPATTPAPAVTGYDTNVQFFATRYHQGGRTVYSLDLSLTQLASLIAAPDPNVTSPGNRRMDPAHARGFGKYVRSQEDWVAPGLLIRGPGVFTFEARESIQGAEFGIVSLPRLAALDLHIVEGQHRVLGVHLALREIAEEMDKVRGSLAAAKRMDDKIVIDDLNARLRKLNKQKRRFENDRISVLVYVEEEQAKARQMFFDISDNQKGITASVRTRFDARSVANRAAQQVMEHPLLAGRVDEERDRLGRTNPNLLSAKHVQDIVRIVTVGLDGRITVRLESELNADEMARRATDFLDLLVEAFPKLRDVEEGKLSPDLLREASMLGSPVTIRALAGLYYELVTADGHDHETMRAMLKGLNGSLGGRATARLSAALPEGVLEEGALAPGSRRQEVAAFKDALVEWVEPKQVA